MPSSRTESLSTRIDVINTEAGRILCLADVRGAISMLNELAIEHRAIAIIHTGDFGYYEPSSVNNITDRTLKHLMSYNSLIPPSFKAQLTAPSTTIGQARTMLVKGPSESNTFVLSEFPKLLSGELKLIVPVYTIWGACEDVAILEKMRLAAPSPITVPTVDSLKSIDPSSLPNPSGYSIPNLTVLDEATTRVLVIGGVRLRLFGLGGAVVAHKLFDNGSGNATIAGGGGTMWTTVLQIGELVDTAQKVYDASETRILVTHSSPSREGLLSQLALVLKADFTISGSLHFRYGVSYNEFAAHGDIGSWASKLENSKRSFMDVWESVKSRVEEVVDSNQKALLNNALAVTSRVVAAPANGQAVEEIGYKNCWNWNLPDAAFGSLVLDIKDGRVGSELKDQGFNFAYRVNGNKPESVPAASPSPSTNAPAASSTPVAVPPQPNAPVPVSTEEAPAPSPAPEGSGTLETPSSFRQPFSRGHGNHSGGSGGSFSSRGRGGFRNNWERGEKSDKSDREKEPFNGDKDKTTGTNANNSGTIGRGNRHPKSFKPREEQNEVKEKEDDKLDTPANPNGETSERENGHSGSGAENGVRRGRGGRRGGFRGRGSGDFPRRGGKGREEGLTAEKPKTEA